MTYNEDVARVAEYLRDNPSANADKIWHNALPEISDLQYLRRVVMYGRKLAEIVGVFDNPRSE